MFSRSTTPPLDAAGLRKFAEIEDALEPLLTKLWAAEAVPRGKHDSIPATPGVYLFTNNGTPLYVGQTQSLRQRLGLHTRRGSPQNHATFAFNLAKHEAAEKGLSLKGTRETVAADPEFKPFFHDAKATVANMDVRFVEVPDPELRTVFEVYVALALGTTEFNSFEMH